MIRSQLDCTSQYHQVLTKLWCQVRRRKRVVKRRQGPRISPPITCKSVTVIKATRYEIIKRLFKSLLWVMVQMVPAIPASGLQSTRRVIEAIECKRKVSIRSIYILSIIEFICFRIIKAIIGQTATVKTINTLQITFNIGAPFSLFP